ncbi:hypothetical protein MGN70_003834 [Eutypa lata]|nr:hypothetical protein MGN70_003834 [Eutypa lata]
MSRGTNGRNPEFNPVFIPDVVNVTHRDDLSLIYKIIRIAVLWPLRPHLVSYKKRYPGGSQRLYQHPRRLHGITIKESKAEIPSTSSPSDYGTANPYAFSVPDVIWLYEFEPPSTGFAPTLPPLSPSSSLSSVSASDPLSSRKASTAVGGGADTPRGPHTIYYFPGGGFRAPPSSKHWKFCAQLASSLSLPPLGNTSTAERAETVAHVVLVSYPLAPHSPARDSLPLLRRWLEQVLVEAAPVNGTLTLAGDGAGANVALSLGLWVADRIATLEGPGVPGSGPQHKSTLSTGLPESKSVTNASVMRRLRSIMVISPPTDLRPNRHSASRADADARDKVMGQGAADEAAVAWSKGSFTDGQNRYLSPGLADLANLRASEIRIDGVIGTADVEAHDSMVFLQRCREAEVPGRWLVWEGQMHCFPLAACYGLREGKEAREWVADVLRGGEKGRERRQSSVQSI